MDALRSANDGAVVVVVTEVPWQRGVEPASASPAVDIACVDAGLPLHSDALVLRAVAPSSGVARLPTTVLPRCALAALAS